MCIGVYYWKCRLFFYYHIFDSNIYIIIYIAFIKMENIQCAKFIINTYFIIVRINIWVPYTFHWFICMFSLINHFTCLFEFCNMGVFLCFDLCVDWIVRNTLFMKNFVTMNLTFLVTFCGSYWFCTTVFYFCFLNNGSHTTWLFDGINSQLIVKCVLCFITKSVDSFLLSHIWFKWTNQQLICLFKSKSI